MRNMGKCSLGFYAKGILMELQHYRLLFLIPFPTLGFLELGKSTSKHPPPTLLNSVFGEKTKQNNKEGSGKKENQTVPLFHELWGSLCACVRVGQKRDGTRRGRMPGRAAASYHASLLLRWEAKASRKWRDVPSPEE